jgi:hypothetical protein
MLTIALGIVLVVLILTWGPYLIICVFAGIAQVIHEVSDALSPQRKGRHRPYTKGMYTEEEYRRIALGRERRAEREG